MQKWGWLWILLALSSCGERKFPRPDFDSVSFETTEQAKLFFKNVRSYYYEADVYSFPGAEIYRWRARDTDTTKVWVQPVLVIHLNAGQAFLLSERSAAAKTEALPWLYARQTNGSTDSIGLEPASMADHLAIHVRVYDAIDRGDSLYFKRPSGETIAYLTARKARDGYHKQVRDFLRLGGNIR